MLSSAFGRPSLSPKENLSLHPVPCFTHLPVLGGMGEDEIQRWECGKPKACPERIRRCLGKGAARPSCSSAPSAAPTRPPEGSKCTKHQLFGNLVVQQVAGEGRRWEGVWDDVPNLKSLLLWASPQLHHSEESLREQCLTPRYLGSISPP